MALKGIKVIELAGLAPAPFCGMVLADFGATVIRVDKIHANTQLDCLGNGKQSIALNLKSKEGVNILKKLSKTSDVLLEPFRKGVMESMGLGPDVLMKENPKLIYARLSGYGHYGPYSKRAGHDINYVAMSGILSLFGRYKEKPLFPVNLAADFGGGGLTCALGILMALIERNNSGRGQIVDCSMVEGTAYLGSWLYRSRCLPIWGRERGRNILDSGSHFYDVYETKDGKYLAVGALEPQFYDRLLEGLQFSDEELPQYGDFEENRKILAEKFREKTREEWMEIFQDVDACVTPVLDLDEAPKHVHNADRSSFVETDSGDVPKPAPVLSRTPGSSKSLEKQPACGENTVELLRSLLNYNEKQISDLEEQGVIECAKKSKL